jgi:hypothetical protein
MKFRFILKDWIPLVYHKSIQSPSELTGDTRTIFTFPRWVFLSFSTVILTMTLSKTEIETPLPLRDFFVVGDGILIVYASASKSTSLLKVTRPSSPSLKTEN